MSAPVDTPEAVERLCGFFDDRASFGFIYAGTGSSHEWDALMKTRATEARAMLRRLHQRAVGAEERALALQDATARHHLKLKEMVQALVTTAPADAQAALDAVVKEAVAKEREANASLSEQAWTQSPDEIAAMIRARGDA